MTPQPEAGMTAEMRLTRRDINGQITDKLRELGISGEFRNHADHQGGRMLWTIAGQTMTTGEAADAYLPGGFKGNFGSMGGLTAPAKPQTTTELAAIIAGSPRFADSHDSRYFDEYAAKYGRDVAGLAFVQACLKYDQDKAAQS